MLRFQPKKGSIVYCDFKGFISPEIVKRRPVIIVEKNRKNSKLVTIVPLSKTEPIPSESYHVEMDVAFRNLHLKGKRSWVKCDLVNTVSVDRLNMIKDTVTGTRYVPQVEDTFLLAVKEAIKIAHRL